MPGYPAADTDRQVAAADLLAVTTAIFRRCGMADADAALLADTLVRADLRGVHSHGVMRVPDYVTRLTRGGVDPRGRPRVVRELGACLTVDGGNSMGQIGAHFAMTEVIERARTSGIAAAAVRGSNHCGAMATYAMQALPHDMIGWATTNALPTMAPWGGAERLLGINPLAVAIPAGIMRPLVFDAAFAAAAHGKLRIYQQKGLRLPEGWALDASGQPTTDPAVAVGGLLMPIGGYKGTALAMVMGIHAAILSGASYGTELGSMEDGPRAGQDGQFLMAVNIAAFEDVDRFKARVDDVIRQLRACRRAPGVDRVYAPGEIELETEDRYRRDGVPLPDQTITAIAETARGLGLDEQPLPTSAAPPGA